MIVLLINVITWVGGTLLSLLPSSPFADMELEALDVTGLQWLNWCMPISTLIGILAAWLAAAAVYIVVQMVLRFFRVIG